MFLATTPETEAHTELTPQQPQPSVKSLLAENTRLCNSLRYPSLPGNLDIASGLAEIQKHLSDPVLPIMWKSFPGTSMTLKVLKHAAYRLFEGSMWLVSDSGIITHVSREQSQSRQWLQRFLFHCVDSELKPVSGKSNAVIMLSLRHLPIYSITKSAHVFFTDRGPFSVFLPSLFSKICKCHSYHTTFNAEKLFY